MTFPVLSSTVAARNGSNLTHVTAATGAVAIGDLLVMFMSINNTNGSAGLTTVDDFTRVTVGGSDGAGFIYDYVFTRVVTGTESWYNAGAGGTLTVRHGNLNACHYYINRVTGWGEIGSTYAGSAGVAAVTADPPLNAPTWGATRDTLWLAYGGIFGNPVYTSSPALYTPITHQDGTDATFDVSTALASRAVLAASQDPGVFTWNGPQAWGAFTVAISDVVAAGFVGEPGGGLW